METAQAAPAGFRDIPAEESTGIRIDKAALTHGVILQFRGTRKFDRKNGDGQTVVHTFLAHAGDGTGARFSLFGTAQLDSKLKSIRSGGVVWLSYGGKKTIDGQEAHDWNVSDGGRLTDDALTVLRKHSAKEEAALDVAIAAAQKDNSSRRQIDNANGFDSTEGDFHDFDFPNR